MSVSNDYLDEQRGLQAKAEVYDLQSRRIGTVKARVDVPANGVANDVLRIASKAQGHASDLCIVLPDDITPVFFISLELTDIRGNVVSRNFYWQSTDKYEGKQTVTGPCTSGFEPLATLPEARPAVSTRRLTATDGYCEWEVSVRNSSSRIAFFCQLLLTDMKDKPLHGTYYSDNFFSLLPGEKKLITIRTAKQGNNIYHLRFCENMAATRNVVIR